MLICSYPRSVLLDVNLLIISRGSVGQVLEANCDITALFT